MLNGPPVLVSDLQRPPEFDLGIHIGPALLNAESQSLELAIKI